MSYTPPPPGGYGYPGATPPPPPGFAAVPPPGNPNVYNPLGPATFATGGECPQANQALLCSILSLFCFGFVLGPVAIIMALNAKKIIAMNPGMSGEGKAIAALVIGAVALVINVGGIAASFIIR